MKGRLLLCIGCNSYDAIDIDDLNAAEKDAQDLYEALVTQGTGSYDEQHSKLLFSPTLSQIRAYLTEIAKSKEVIQTLTVFYAGHGAIHNGNLYLYSKDSDEGALSVTTFSLSELLRMISDQQVPHTNIILDACQAGGFLSDLGPLLNSTAIGGRDTPAVSLVAMAASDEYAGEDDAGGFGTQALMECISGQRVCNTEFPTLDLMEIGRELSSAFEGQEQMPVRWGLNLTRSSLFCLNPCYAGDKKEPQNLLPKPLSSAQGVPEDVRAKIWTTYLNLGDSWGAREFYELLDRTLASDAWENSARASFVENLALSFSEQAEHNSDKSVVSEVLAICGLVLLKWREDGHEADAVCKRLFLQSLNWAVEQIGKLSKELETNRYALLSRQDGAFDFYYLAIRITKVLGWASATILCAAPADKSDSAALLNKLTDNILSNYAMNLIVMNEAQAGGLALLGAALTEIGDADRLESLLSYYLHSLSRQKGMIAPHSLPTEKIFDFLVARYQSELKPGSEVSAQPSELVALCIYLSILADMSDVMDDMMSDLDYVWLNAYLAKNYTKIGDDTLEDGTNVTIRIGHDIWRVAEFREAWRKEEVSAPSSDVQFMAGVLASLVFDDRVSWFALPTI